MKKTGMYLFNLFLLSFLFLRSYGQTSLNEGLLAYYPFDGNAKELTKHKNDAVVFDATLTSDRFNTENQAYHFNGISSYLVAPHQKYLNLSGTNYNISFWFKKDGASDPVNDVFIAKRNGDSLKGYVASSTNNQAKNNTAFLVSRGTDPRIISKETFDFNEWHHISINYNAAEKQVSLFVDGVFDSAVQDFPSPLPTQSNLYIGKDGYLNTYYYNGSLDEIRIYGRELSVNEIHKLSNDEFSDLLAYYPFDGNAKDLTKHKNDAEVFDATLTSDRFNTEIRHIILTVFPLTW